MANIDVLVLLCWAGLQEAYRTETSRWRNIEESEWERCEIKRPVVNVLEAKAYIEVATRPPRRTTIRII